MRRRRSVCRTTRRTSSLRLDLRIGLPSVGSIQTRSSLRSQELGGNDRVCRASARGATCLRRFLCHHVTMGSKRQFERSKEEVKCDESVMLELLSEWEPVEMGAEYVVSCPFGSHRKLARVWLGNTDYWLFTCFPCDIKGIDAFSLVMLMDEVDFLTARNKLINRGPETVALTRAEMMDTMPLPREMRPSKKPMVLACEVSGCSRRHYVTWEELAYGVANGRLYGGLISEAEGTFEWLCPTCETKLPRIGPFINGTPLKGFFKTLRARERKR